MDSISKEHVISGLIGGAASIIIAIAVRKLIWRRGGWGRKWRESKIVTMESENMPAAIGPYSKGKMVQMGSGSCFAWSSGQIGVDPKTNKLVSADDVAA